MNCGGTHRALKVGANSVFSGKTLEFPLVTADCLMVYPYTDKTEFMTRMNLDEIKKRIETTNPNTIIEKWGDILFIKYNNVDTGKSDYFYLCKKKSNRPEK